MLGTRPTDSERRPMFLRCNSLIEPLSFTDLETRSKVQRNSGECWGSEVKDIF